MISKTIGLQDLRVINTEMYFTRFYLSVMLAEVNCILNEDKHLVARRANSYNQYKVVNSTTWGHEL